MGTDENLKAAFAGESQANRRYLAYAKKAEADGYLQIAKVFRSAAGAETVHAHAHLRVFEGPRKTADNLQTAIDGEAYEFTKMYPEFLSVAENDSNKPATDTFKNAMAVEQIHHGMFTDALNSLNAGKDLPAAHIFVCDICGNTITGEAPDTCSICGALKKRFFEVT